ncbi:hypothetical protein [Nocardioides sp. LHG3406-4]|uniref:hypothetical protein n=1 Tax=Nocardioides sp. LHG3406-4 TaxID=2804575 RepID=UPI003CFAB3A9
MPTTHLVDSLVRAPYWLGSRLRRARMFHPRGIAFAARLHLTGEGPLPTGEHACLVRLSKALGTPGDLPDILGVGLRLEVDGEPVDVLAATCAGFDGWRRLVLWPVASWSTARLSSLMAWESEDGARAQVLMETADPGLPSPDVRALAHRLPVRLRVRVVGRHGDLQTGALVVEGPRVQPVDFDPVLHHPRGWRLVPDWLASARASAYDASRNARPDTVGPGRSVRAGRARGGSSSR